MTESLSEKELQTLREMKEERENVTIYKAPIRTTKLFLIVAYEYIRDALHAIRTHPVTIFIAIPSIIIYLIALYFPGSHTPYVNLVTKAAELVVWWVGLGILSSVGLGTGMHSGLLFLFPYVIKVTLAAQECHSLNFESLSSMWFREDPNAFQCPDDDDQVVPVTFLGIFLKVFIPCFLWGAGTAIGEIPPYALAKAKAKAGEEIEEFDNILRQTKQEKEHPEQQPKRGWCCCCAYGLTVEGMKRCMLEFVERWGFWGVLFLSAYPNMAFDLCGICCGYFQMPFWTFFSACLLGKGVIKVSGQAVVLITLFTEVYLEAALSFLEKLLPAFGNVHAMIETGLHSYKQQFHGKKTVEGGTNWFLKAFNIFVFGCIIYFVLSCMTQFAQQRIAREHAEQLKKQKKQE